MRKMTDEELIKALNAGKTDKEIARHYNYDRTQRISEIKRQLKDKGYEILDTTSKASDGAGIQVSISSSKIEELGFDSEDELWYMRSLDSDQDLRIYITDDSSESTQKLSKISSQGDRMAYITGKQLSKIGFEDRRNIFVRKDLGASCIDLMFSTRRVIE